MKFLLNLFLFLIILNLSSGFCSGQSKQLDSLENLLKTTKQDTNRVKLLIKIANRYKSIDPEKTVSYSKQALHLAQSIHYTKGIFKSFEMLAHGMQYTNQYTEALPIVMNWEHVCDSLGDLNQKAQSLNMKGLIYSQLGDYSKSVENYFAAIKIDEAADHKEALAGDYGNIALVYEAMKKYSTALEYIAKAMSMDSITDNKKGYANALGNLSNIYDEMGDHKKALIYALRFLLLEQELGNEANVAGALSNIGSIYDAMDERDKAIEYYLKSLPIAEKIGNNDIIMANQLNIGNWYIDKSQFTTAIEMIKSATAIAIETGSKPHISECYRLLALAYNGKKDFAKAYEYLDKFNQLKDTLYNEENTRQINQMSAMYEKDKQQIKIDALEKEKIFSKQIIEKQNNFRNVLILVVVLIVLLAVALFIGFNNKRKDNRLLELRNLEIQKQKEIITETNKSMTDSINYAKRIQESVLPAKEVKYHLFPDAFVFYQPRDIVSGDFYWFAEKNNKRIIAAVDCTGHGVPGAFMSMVGIGQLNNIVMQNNITKPSEILNQLQINIHSELKQNNKDTSARDGMDVAICSFDYENKTIEYAGANRPLIIINKLKNDLNTIDPDHFSVGGTDDIVKAFTNHVFDFSIGDCFYIFSDGFPDQFGGPKGKKFRIKNLKELLLSISQKKMSEQEDILSKTFTDWKGNLEQVDDILVIGIRA
jgi:serine phosphatase RsbU (regulator of sigma subunit)